MRISDWSSDVCSSDLAIGAAAISRNCPPIRGGAPIIIRHRGRTGRRSTSGRSVPTAPPAGPTTMRIFAETPEARPRPHANGFTLVELQVVLAIMTPAATAVVLPTPGGRAEERRVG